MVHTKKLSPAIPVAVSPFPAGLTWLAGAGAPVDGVTGAGMAGIGSLYTDTDTGVTYLNQGTLAVPAWKGIINA